VWNYVEGMRQSATDDVVRGIAVGEASLLTMNHDEEREEEIYRRRRRRRTEGTETPKTFVMSIVSSCGSCDRKRWRTGLHFGGGESLDDHHWATALGAAPKIVQTIGDGRVLFDLRRWFRRKQLQAQRQGGSAAAIG
jgi:hypothetical protein